MIVDCAVYERGLRQAQTCSLHEAVAQANDPGTFAWIGLFEPTSEELAQVTDIFGLHPLAVEDALHAHQRPKLEHYGEHSLLVFKTARYVDHDEVIALGEVLLFVGERFLISVRHGDAGNMGAVRRTLESEPERLAKGAGAIVYELADRIADEFGVALKQVETDIDEIQAEVFKGPKASHAGRIFNLKREVLEFRQAATPLVDPLDELMRTVPPGFTEELQPYFRDVHDHVVRATQRLAAIDDLLSSALDANVAQVSMRQNEDMRKISAWAAIVSVPTAIAGVYGMNFRHMPELEWRYGYPIVVAAIVVVCVALYRNFKRREWL
jgi:magnesium transporter